MHFPECTAARLNVLPEIGRNWKRWLFCPLQDHWMICALSAVLTPYTSMQLALDGIAIVYVSELPATGVSVNDCPQADWVSCCAVPAVTQRLFAVLAIVLLNVVAACAAAAGTSGTRIAARTAATSLRGDTMLLPPMGVGRWNRRGWGGTRRSKVPSRLRKPFQDDSSAGKFVN